MKKDQTTKQTTQQADSKPYDSEAWRDEMALLEIREQVEKNIPPVSEIAHLAALLTHGSPVALQNPEVAARQAVEAWAACSRQRAAWIDDLARRQLLKAKESAKAKESEEELLKPKKSHSSLDEFLDQVLAKERSPDRMKIYRSHLRTDLTPDGLAVIHRTEDEANELLKQKRERGFNEEQFRTAAEMLLNYLPRYKAKLLQTRGQAAGKASASKRTAKRKARPPVEKLKAALLT